MKIALLSDIHGNCDALLKVLEDIDTLQPDITLCLGDCIGYGPEPEEVVQLIRQRGIPTIAGNHEMAVRRPGDLKWFNAAAKRSLELSLTRLSAATIEFIHRLPTSMVVEGCRCAHGFPPDSTSIYLFQKSSRELAAAFTAMEERICFVGHTHNLKIVCWDGKNVYRGPLPIGLTRLDPRRHYIINVGSVGQPRDGSPQAKYVLWDTRQNLIEVRAINYAISTVQRKILEAGLPREHAQRLGAKL